MPAVPESHSDLLGARWATLATIDGDGRPQMTAVSFLAEGGTVRVSLNMAREKTKNLMRNPAVSLFILDPANVMRYLELRGDAEIEPDEDGSFAARAGAKDGVDLCRRDRPGETRVIVTIRPTKVHAAQLPVG